MIEDVAGAAAALRSGANVLGEVVLFIGSDRERQRNETRFFMSSCLGLAGIALAWRLHRGSAVAELVHCCLARPKHFDDTAGSGQGSVRALPRPNP